MARYPHLTEARVRDSERRKAAGETRPAPEGTEGGSLETRLLVSLESSGRPLAARTMAERLRELARRGE